jgi:ring-1,2-phenylacetyl-CoA epoxidase subunit PaaC
MNSSAHLNSSSEALSELLVALADDELILGHRDSEWTGHSPILEEDIAFSNLAQDEIGHALVWLSINESIGGKSPDWMGFERKWNDFTCSHFVQYPKHDYAYTVVRQFLFDAAERIRLQSLKQSSFQPIKEAAKKILREEHYHLLHSQGLVERLGGATEESHRRMQEAVDAAFPQSLGLFEPLVHEGDLVKGSGMKPSSELQEEWLGYVVPILESATLLLPTKKSNGKFIAVCAPEYGGRSKQHTPHLQSLVADMQSVYQIAPESKW